MYEGPMATCRSWFSLSTTWVPVMDSDLASTVTLERHLANLVLRS